MILVIDIGNTHTVVGLLHEKTLVYHWRITSNLMRTEDEIGGLLSFFFNQKGYKTDEVEGVCISSVVPDLTSIYAEMSHRYLKTKPLIIDATLDLGIKVRYRDPSTVGADRLSNAVAGIHKYGKPLIIIDFGTATTFDCIDSNGDYVGGVISPGIETSINALHLRAAKLPRVELQFPEKVIGSTTEESIQIGILYGTVHIIEGLTRQLKEELGRDTKVIATGGLSTVISKRTNSIDIVDPYLSLEGIAEIYYRNRKAKNI
ncbi:MAG: type III pantothenate kinase [Calditrichaceae bacterium]